MAPYFWLQPAVTGAAAIFVLLGAGLTIRQRYRADRKDQWWKRTQWAFELLLTGEEDREVLGLLVLAQQAAAKAADTEDGAFIADVDCATGAAPCLTASDDHGFTIDEAEVVYWGRCPACAVAAPDPTRSPTPVS